MACVPGQVYSEGEGVSQTCGNASLVLHNNSVTRSFVVIPRLSRGPGTACLVAPGFTPFVLAPRAFLSLNVPTLVAEDSATPPGGGEAPEYFPYSNTQQVAYVDVTSVLLPGGESGITSTTLASHASDMFDFLANTTECDMGTLTTASFVINTCSADRKGYAFGPNNAVITDTYYGYRVSTTAGKIVHGMLADPQAIDVLPGGTLGVYFEDLSDDVMIEGDDSWKANLTEAQRTEIQEPWLISFMIAMLVIGVLIVCVVNMRCYISTMRKRHEFDLHGGLASASGRHADLAVDLPGGRLGHRSFDLGGSFGDGLRPGGALLPTGMERM
jgi:hypothetical protein